MTFIGKVEGEKLPSRIGNDARLHMDLCMNGMMNELRRRPDLIPPIDGRTPVSLQIPFLSGNEKVEYGYRAGSACITQKDNTTLELKQVDLFPACISLVLISLWYEAYESANQSYSCTLRIPDTEDDSAFRSLINRITPKLSFLDLKIEKFPGPCPAPTPARTASGSMMVVHGLQQIDIGRFVVTGQVLKGSLSVRDSITLTDGSGNILREYCPIQGIYQGTGINAKEITTADRSSGPVQIAVAFWFPAGASFNGLILVKEDGPVVFTPPVMPPEVRLLPPTRKKGFFARLFS